MPDIIKIKSGGESGCFGASRKFSTRGLWSADGALQATRKPQLEAPLAHILRYWFQTNTTAQAACGSTRGMDRAGIGVFSEVTGACRELKIYYFLPFDCSPPSQFDF